MSKLTDSSPPHSCGASAAIIPVPALEPLRLRTSAAEASAFRFVNRAESRERAFKVILIVATIAPVLALVLALPVGRYWSTWLLTRARWLALETVRLKPDHAEIEADWMRKRSFDVSSTVGRWPRPSPNTLPPCSASCFAELDPDHALVRWGNFDRTVLLPGKIFEADDTGRSYRFRPNVRSIWVRNFPVKGQVKAYFQVLDKPEVAELLQGTGAQLVEGSVQTTNSWGLRGPEPNLKASWRGIALGDSYLQGLFVGDQETPTECLKRELASRLLAPVEILNTGHLGYSPEQYYYTLVEFGRRFPPQFVVVSIFANDAGGDVEGVLHGNADWQESGYWLGRIRQYCLERNAHLLVVPAALDQTDRRAAARRLLPWLVLECLGSNRSRIPRSDRRLRQCASRGVARLEASREISHRQFAFQRSRGRCPFFAGRVSGMGQSRRPPARARHRKTYVLPKRAF